MALVVDRCRARRAPPDTDARPGSCRAAGAGKAVRIQLHDRRVVDSLEEVAPLRASIVSPCCGRVWASHDSRSCISAFSASMGPGSPCTRHRRRGAAGSVPSHRGSRRDRRGPTSSRSCAIARVHRDAVAVDLYFACAVDELSATGAGCLIADEEHRVPRIRQRRRKVMQNAAAGRHSTRRDHDRRLAAGGQLLGLLRRRDRLKPRRRERVTPDRMSAANPGRVPRHARSST